MPKVGRPSAKSKINKEALEKMAEKMWTIEEIAAAFRVTPKTIRKHYYSFIEECRQRGRYKLRDLQWQRALAGSDRVLLHMSKHYLDQHEKIESTVHQTVEQKDSPALKEVLEHLKEDEREWNK